MYREVVLPCPQCGISLTALEGRDKWRCTQCVGVLLGSDQLAVELGELGCRAIFAAQRRREGIRPCPRCQQPLEPIELAGIPIERCPADTVAWFGRGVLGRACRELPNDTDQAAAAFLAKIVRDAGG